jgi:hypothetical protein
VPSDDDGRPAGFCLISTPLVRMIKNTPLNYGYICPIGADVIQTELAHNGSPSYRRNWDINHISLVLLGKPYT